MRIGIVSDSHGKAGRLKAGLQLLLARNVEAVVHCGDVGSTDCVGVLAETGLPAYMVAGNMDRHVERLQAEAERRGVHFAWEVVEVPIGDRKHLVATHGSDDRVLGELIADEQFPYVCHGHTHHQRDERIGKVRIINPGALHHARRRSVAVLDTETDALEYIQVK